MGRGSGTELKVWLSSKDLVPWEMDSTLVTFRSSEGLLKITSLWRWTVLGVCVCPPGPQVQESLMNTLGRRQEAVARLAQHRNALGFFSVDGKAVFFTQL